MLLIFKFARRGVHPPYSNFINLAPSLN